MQDAVGADVVGAGHRDAAPAERRLDPHGPSSSRRAGAPRLDALAVDLLQRQHLRLAVARGGDRARGGVAARQRRDAGDPARDRGAADLPAVGARARARRRVDDEVDLAGLDAVGDVRRALADLLEHRVDAHAHAADRLRGAGRRDDAEAEVAEQRGDPRRGRPCRRR